MSKILIQIQLTIMTYVVVGVLLGKLNIINESSQRFLSKLIIDVLLPISVFVSFYNSFSWQLISNFIVIFLIALILEIVIYILSAKKIKGFTKEENAIARYIFLVSNGGLVGNPIMEGLLGEVGIVLCNVFMIPTRIMAYSGGDLIFTQGPSKSVKETIKALLLNKVVIAMLVALVIVQCKIVIPKAILTGLKNIGNCLSPVSLTMIGSMLIDGFKTKQFKLKKLTIVCFVRLVLIPLFVLSICFVFKLSITNTIVLVLLMGMPAGSTTASFAQKYEGDVAFASTSVVISTLASSLTLVLLMKLIETIF